MTSAARAGQSSLFPTTPEAEFLCLCARELRRPSADRRPPLALPPLNWSALHTLAYQHGMLPALYQWACNSAAEAVPAATVAPLRAECASIAAYNLRLAVELAAILDLFGAHGVRAIPYKGVVLAQRLYGSIGLRQIGDLDILIAPGDVIRARRLLLDRGYFCRSRLVELPLTRWLEYQHQLRHPAADVVVELHWRIAPRSVSLGLGFEELWSRRTALLLCGRAVPCLSAEDLLVALCVHGCKHQWKRLEWVWGVAELARWELAWTQVHERAHRAGAVRMLHLGLTLAHDLLAAPVPAEVLRDAGRDPRVAALQTWVRTALAEGAAAPAGIAAPRRRRFQLLAQDRLGAKLRYLWYSPLTQAVRAAGSAVNGLWPTGPT